jgi:pilin isopeptide linkage protein/LPXTG-motif cell wall-anchored protein
MKTKNFWKKTGIWALTMVLLGSFMTAQVLADEEEDDPVPSITITVQSLIKGDYPAEDKPPVVYQMKLQSEVHRDDSRFEDFPVAAYADLEEEAEEEDETLEELLDETRVRVLTIHGEGEDSFEPLHFTEPGTYVYTIDQMDFSHKGYTGDDTVYTLTVEVYVESSDSLGCYATLKDEEGQKEEIATFTLEYEEPETPIVEVTPSPEPETPNEEPTPTPEPETPNEEPTPTPEPETPAEEPTPAPEVPEPSEEPGPTETPEATPAPTATPVPSTKGNNPKTGDTTNIAAPLSLLVLTALALVAVVLRKKENYK